MKKKIIFVTEALWIGGIETALVNLLNKLDYNKYEVTVLVIRAELNMKSRINKKCNLIVLDRSKSFEGRKKYRFSKLYSLMEESEEMSKLHRLMLWSVPIIKWLENRLFIQYVRKQMNNEKYDVGIIYSDRTAEITIRAINAKKYLMFYHNGLIASAYHDEIAYKKCQKIIAVSEEKEKELKKYRPKYANKIISIHNIVGIEEILNRSRVKLEQPFDTNRFNIVTCGRLTHQKAIDWAIIACKELLERGYSEVQWWVVGGGPDEKKLKEQIQDSEIENHFHLLGMKENPYPYIANADLYVQPSRYENYSVVVLEAMVLCRPILATKPAAEQQIISGLSGALCDNNPSAICEAIINLINNPNEREKYVDYLKNNSLEKENNEIMKKIYSNID